MKKLLSMLTISSIIGSTSTNVISCDKTKAKDNKINLSNFKLNNIDLPKGKISQEDVIIAIEQQISDYSNISLDKVKNDVSKFTASKGMDIYLIDENDVIFFDSNDPLSKLKKK